MHEVHGFMKNLEDGIARSNVGIDLLEAEVAGIGAIPLRGTCTPNRWLALGVRGRAETAALSLGALLLGNVFLSLFKLGWNSPAVIWSNY